MKTTVSTESLSAAIDRVNDAHFFGPPLSDSERLRLAHAIAERHGQPHAYAGTFGLSDEERQSGISLFTGERATNASARHIAGEEGCRALRLLDVPDEKVRAALEGATASLLACLHRSEHTTRTFTFTPGPGTFCCGPCTVSVWRHLTSGGLDRHEERLECGLRRLGDYRTADGRFRVFPFWYTVSALAEIDLTGARQEIDRLAPILERAARRSAGSEPYSARRQEIARRALARI